MAAFDPLSAALGGALIGLAVAWLVLFNGRLAGISGIVGEFIATRGEGRVWRAAFLLGLVFAPVIAGALGHPLPVPRLPQDWAVVTVGGLLVGFGSRLANGCTSGHGICGIALLSPRSLAGTAVFMTVAAVVVALSRHGPWS